MNMEERSNCLKIIQSKKFCTKFCKNGQDDYMDILAFS